MALSDYFKAALMGQLEDGLSGVSKSFVAQKNEEEKQAKEDALTKLAILMEQAKTSRLYEPERFESPTGQTIPRSELRAAQYQSAATGQIPYEMERIPAKEAAPFTIQTGVPTPHGMYIAGYSTRTGAPIFKDVESKPANIAARAVETAVKKDQDVRDQKLMGANKIIDFFEEKIGEIPSGTGLGGRIKGIGTKIGSWTQLNPEAAAYESSLEGLRSQLARGLGEVGALSDPEQQAAKNLLPLITDNTETRAKKIKNFRDYVNTKINEKTEKKMSPVGLQTPKFSIEEVK